MWLWMLARYMTASFLQTNYMTNPEIQEFMTAGSFDELKKEILAPGEDAQGITLRLAASAFKVTINTYVLRKDSGQ